MSKIGVKCGFLGRESEVYQIMDDGSTLPVPNVSRLQITVEPGDSTRAEVELFVHEVRTAEPIEAEFVMMSRTAGLKRVSRVVFEDGTEDVYEENTHKGKGKAG